MNNNDRYILLSKLEEMSELKLGDGSKITKLDYLIYTDYRCGHEYGICHKISGGELLCNCLDCGDALDEIHYREIYDISDNMDFRAIRRDYLNYLLENSSEESVSDLSKTHKIKLRQRIVKTERR